MTPERKKILRKNRLRVDEENVFYSPYSEVAIPSDRYFHDFMWENLDKFWDRTATVCLATGRAYTFGELRRLSGRFATSLRKQGLRPGDLIASILPNIPEFVIVFLGAMEAGIRLTFVNPMFTMDEMVKQLINSDAQAVVTVSSKYQIVAESISRVASIQLPAIVFDDGTPSPLGVLRFKDLVAENVTEFNKTQDTTSLDAAKDTAILPYSSGTTGRPKGVELTHKNLVANIMQLEQWKAEEIVDHFGETFGGSQEIVPLIFPVFHMGGIFSLFNRLRRGTKVIFIAVFTSEALLKVLKDYSPTTIPCVPLVLQLMTSNSRFTKNLARSIRTIASGAASLGEAAIQKFTQKFGKREIFQAYGMTESTSTVTIGGECSIGSVGSPLPNTQIRIVGVSEENHGRNLGVNEVGEIWFKGPQVMKGYFKNPEATQDIMRGDWLRSGDLGRFDENGDLWITGRIKELIKVKGWQVAPAEIEDILLAHEDIADAAVAGVPHEKFGEIPKAFVVLKKGRVLSETEIKNFVSKRVISYKQLGHVAFVDKIPKNPSGKILRNKLNDMCPLKSKL